MRLSGSAPVAISSFGMNSYPVAWTPDSRFVILCSDVRRPQSDFAELFAVREPLLSLALVLFSWLYD